MNSVIGDIYEKRRSRGERAIGVAIAALGITGTVEFFQMAREPMETARTLAAVVFWRRADLYSFTLLGSALLLIGLWSMGPEELRLDFGQRTYHVTRGWPFWVREVEGGLNDIACLYHLRVKRKGIVRYHMLAEWNGGQPTPFLLGVARSPEEAEERLAPLAEKIGTAVETAPTQPNPILAIRRKLSFPALIALTLYLSGVILAQALPNLAVQRELDARGVPGTAIITSRNSDSEPGVEYQYTPHYRTYHGRSRLTPADYGALRVGDSIPIVYLPGDPAVSRAAQSVLPRQMVGKVAIVIIQWVLVGILLVVTAARTRKNRNTR